MEKKPLRLPNEIWHTIINFCNNSNPRSPGRHGKVHELLHDSLNPEMRICRQINRETRQIALSIQWKKIILHEFMDIEMFGVWMENIGKPQEFLQFVKEFAFYRDRVNGDPYPSNLKKGSLVEILKDLLRQCNNLEKLTWDARRFFLPSSLSSIIQSKTKVRQIKLYDENLQGVLCSAVPMGWQNLESFTVPGYMDMEGYLTETEFDWIILPKKKSFEVDEVLTLDSRQPLGFSVSKRYRQTRTLQNVVERWVREREEEKVGSVIGNIGMASWLFTSIVDNLHFLLKKMKKDRLQSKETKAPIPISKFKPPLKIGLTTGDVFLLRTAIPLWLFGAEPYWCYCEEYDAGLAPLHDEIGDMQDMKDDMIEDRCNAFTKIRTELLTSKVFVTTVQAFEENQNEETKIDKLNKGILDVCQNLLDTIPANTELEEDVFQQKTLFELESDIWLMYENDHIRQIAYNLVADTNLRSSVARIYLTLKDFQDHT